MKITQRETLELMQECAMKLISSATHHGAIDNLTIILANIRKTTSYLDGESFYDSNSELWKEDPKIFIKAFEKNSE
jgi:hypothetical protein